MTIKTKLYAGVYEICSKGVQLSYRNKNVNIFGIKIVKMHLFHCREPVFKTIPKTLEGSISCLMERGKGNGVSEWACLRAKGRRWAGPKR